MREAIEEFYRENCDLYVRRLSRQAGSYSNAEDVVQEAFLRALQYSDSYTISDNNNLEKWFNSILRRALVDFKRIETKQGMVVETDSGEPESTETSSVD